MGVGCMTQLWSSMAYSVRRDRGKTRGSRMRVRCSRDGNLQGIVAPVLVVPLWLESGVELHACSESFYKG